MYTGRTYAGRTNYPRAVETEACRSNKAVHRIRLKQTELLCVYHQQTRGGGKA